MTLISPACAMSQPSSMPAMRAARVFIAASRHCFVPMRGSLAHGPGGVQGGRVGKLGMIARASIGSGRDCGFRGLHRLEARYRGCCNAVLICTNPAPRFLRDNPAKPCRMAACNDLRPRGSDFLLGFRRSRRGGPAERPGPGGTLVLALSREPRARISERP